MNIVAKWDHRIEQGIHKVSAKVRSWSQIKADAEAIRDYMDNENGKFPAPYKSAYALSHCQMDVGADPFHFFVLNNEFIRGTMERGKKDTDKNFYFPSQIIVNAQILEAPEKLKVNKPMRNVVKINGVMTPQVSIVESMEKNLISVPEACMSYPNRTKKNMDRFYRIKVRYQYPKTVLGVTFLRTKTEWAEGLKAHILQHEIDHANAKNMYYENSNK